MFHFSGAEVKSLTYGLAIISICSMLYIILSGELIGTITRVLFLSSNPNQLALYGLAGAFIIAKNIENQRIAIPSIIVTLLYGLISLSDSLFLAIVLSTLFYFLIISLERDLFIQIFVPLTILLLIIFININIDLGEFIRALIRRPMRAAQGLIYLIMVSMHILAPDSWSWCWKFCWEVLSIWKI